MLNSNDHLLTQSLGLSMGSGVYFSETITIGARTYLVEVKKYRGGQKYMIITQTNVLEREQKPVIVYKGYMIQFVKVMERATRAVLAHVPECETAAVRKRKRKARANPPEFCNSGKRWSAAHDRLLTEHFEKGTDIETLKGLFKRRENSIEVRLYKLGLLPFKE